jgi:hypothetical protein
LCYSIAGTKRRSDALALGALSIAHAWAWPVNPAFFASGLKARFDP